MIKTYILKITKENDHLHFESENDGFGALELYGLIAWKQADITAQIRREITPDTVKRTFVEDAEEPEHYSTMAGCIMQSNAEADQ